ncbi:uncharacterized protein PRCAT00004113001 [Priceomyces carsonii]|uniref:uncharacterized protein n=1 Tax=Priceomyces carsonii TaxID=28549 RepID=UPI002ED91C54|nr:unnamed protein product [Priceomyces carsonii]
MTQISFVKITEDVSIPVKVFINRKKIRSSANSSKVAINQKSIVKLNQVNYLKLSGKDLNSLINDIEKDTLNLLIDKLLEEIYQTSEKGKIVIDLDNTWSCTVILSIEFIINLRFYLNKLSGDDIRLIEAKKAKISSMNDENLGFLIKEQTFSFQEDEEMSKKLVDYKFRREKLINNMNNCLQIYVNKVPIKQT